MPAALQSPKEVALLLTVPWLNSILLHWGVQRTGGRMQQRKRRCFLITNQIAWLTSKDKHTDGASRAWSEVGEEPRCCEIEKKPCQGKNIRQKKLMHWGKILSLFNQSILSSFPNPVCMYTHSYTNSKVKPHTACTVSLGRKHDSTQVRCADHITLPSRKNSHSATKKTTYKLHRSNSSPVDHLPCLTSPMGLAPKNVTSSQSYHLTATHIHDSCNDCWAGSRLVTSLEHLCWEKNLVTVQIQPEPKL